MCSDPDFPEDSAGFRVGLKYRWEKPVAVLPGFYSASANRLVLHSGQTQGLAMSGSLPRAEGLVSPAFAEYPPPQPYHFWRDRSYSGFPGSDFVLDWYLEVLVSSLDL